MLEEARVIEIKGAEQLAALSKRLKIAGQRELQRELSKGISQALKPVTAAARISALRTLPSRGGLAQRVARSSIRTVRRSQGLRLQAKNAYALGMLDRGLNRHPVYGNRKVWVRQAVPSGWWTNPTEAAGPSVRREVEQAMQTVANKI